MGRGRRFLARQEFTTAQQVFFGLVDEFPTVVEPRVFLSYAYLQEGKDWAAAEKALRSILALEPTQAEARRNLDVLLHQQGRNVGSEIA